MKTTRVSLLRIVMAVVLFASGPFAHALSLSFSASPPAKNILLSNPDSSESNTALQPSNNRLIGFGFQPAVDSLLESITIQISATGWRRDSLGKEMLVHLVELDSLTGAIPDISSALDASVLLTQTGPLPRGMGGVSIKDGFYLTFRLDAPMPLKAGQAYAFVVSFVFSSDDQPRLNIVSASSTKREGTGLRYFSINQGQTWITQGAAPVFFLTGSITTETH